MNPAAVSYVNMNPFPERHLDYIHEQIQTLEQYIPIQYNLSPKMDVMLIELTMPDGGVVSKTFTTNKSAAAFVDALLLGYECGAYAVTEPSYEE